MEILSELPEGYELKYCAAGWFVDGRCGYKVTSTYYRSKGQALTLALIKISQFSQLPRTERPSWFVGMD